MPVRYFFGESVGVTPDSAARELSTPTPTAPTSTMGSWGIGPVTIDWSFHFATEFFDGDVKILGVKVASLELNVTGKETLDIGAFGWSVVGTLDVDIAGKEIVAELVVKEGDTIHFDRKFVLFTWATRK